LFTDKITVVGETILPELQQPPFAARLKRYDASDLEGHSLVYACTNDPEVNHKVKQEANARGLLVNVADDSDVCDFISPAVCMADGLVVAVSSHGKNVKAAVGLRNRIQAGLRNANEVAGGGRRDCLPRDRKRTW
jgi:precorrin-2 dehydrogenase/sirohydrochlorin ferrochelatase